MTIKKEVAIFPLGPQQAVTSWVAVMFMQKLVRIFYGCQFLVASHEQGKTIELLALNFLISLLAMGGPEVKGAFN